ncbi:MAG: hypothetical protein DMF71_19345 [Acidobacteria bacterium]|nr:MAG: hypothetical protein DMF71_19345 [Acidobacteriota bacterium]
MFRDASGDFMDRNAAIETKNFKMTRYQCLSLLAALDLFAPLRETSHVFHAKARSNTQGGKKKG